MNTLKALAFAALVVIMPVMAQAVNVVPLKPDSANDAPATVYGTPNNGVSIGKTTAPNEALDIVGNIMVSGTLKSPGAGLTVAITSATIGVGAVVSTFTNTGNAAIGGTLDVAGASSHTGASTFLSTVKPWPRTKAQIDLLVPSAVGLYIDCTDCTLPGLCRSTGTLAAQWRKVESASLGCGTNN